MEEGDEREERIFQAVTLLVAVCEQVTLELQALDDPPLPLLNRIDETHDLAIGFALARPGAKR